MRLSLVVAALLCFTTWMSVVHASHAPLSSCGCMWWSKTRVRLNRIVGYTIQSEGVCPIAAVFKTKLGRTICSDPNSDWAKRAILKVDEDKRKSVTGAGANPSRHRTKGGAHPGQVTSQSQGHTETNNQSHSHLRTV